MNPETKRLRVTATIEYDARVEDYGTSDPVEMAKIDQENWTSYPMMLLSSFEDEEYEIKVEPV